MAHSKRRETWALYAVVSCLMLMGKASLLHAKVWPIAASEKLESEAQEALLLAEPGDTVLLPAGRFVMNQELSITKPSITLKGQGMEQTRLVYGAEAGGAQAIISYADASSIEDLAIEDHPGDGVKIIGAKGASIRRVKVEWTKRGSKSNGAYGLYPVESSNILLEDNVVIGASDSGIYVGQSHDIIVRRNQVEYNVAGIEIENSQRADVYDNTATHNTGGILVFNLPNLMVQGGKGTRIFQNSIQNNNFENFAPKGNSVATVPQGTGILILSNDDIEIFKNTIIDHNTTSIAIASYSITVRAIENANFDAVVTHISIHDNIFRKAGGLAFIGANPLGLLAAALSLPYKIPHITYDGIGESDGKGGFKAAQLSGRDRICISANDYDGSDNAYFGNMQLWTRRWWSPIPGSMNRDLAPHSCSHPPLPAVNLPENPPVLTIDSDKPSQETIMRLCEASPEGINWNALHVDCPLLSQYNLFADPHNPLSQPREGGFTYDLNTPLFSDYASKDRVLFLAPGTSATYQANAPLDLPIGTVIAKTFYFPSDLRDKNSSKHIVETRLLIHRAKSWQALSYQWNSSDGTAKLIRGGTAVPLAWIDAKGRSQTNVYRIPNLAQCLGCHLGNTPIGIKAGYLNKAAHGASEGQNQLLALSSLGRLKGLPSDWHQVPKFPTWNDPASGTLKDRARTYLDINCAHCHNPLGKANSSALFLNLDQVANINSGLCKPPIAAGRGTGGTIFDIVPGMPEQSLLIQRMKSTQAAVKMPELSKTMVHSEGVSLIEDWIKSLPGSCEE